MAYSDYGAFVWLNGVRREDKEDVALFASDEETFGVSSDNPLLMESMNIINNFFLSIDNEVMEVRWGIVENKAGKGMSIYAICTQTV